MFSTIDSINLVSAFQQMFGNLLLLQFQRFSFALHSQLVVYNKFSKNPVRRSHISYRTNTLKNSNVNRNIRFFRDRTIK